MQQFSEPLSVDQVTALLYEAGQTQQARREAGCWPAGYRSGMPEYLRDPEDLKYAEAEFTPPQPNGKQIDTMDQVYGWVNLLPRKTTVEIRNKKLVFDRMRVSPRTGRPIYNWTRLGQKYGLSHTWAKTVWISAVDDITAIANRPFASACAATFARIRAASAAQQLAAPQQPVFRASYRPGRRAAPAQMMAA